MKMYVSILLAFVALLGLAKGQEEPAAPAPPSCDEIYPECVEICTKSGKTEDDCKVLCDGDNAVCKCMAASTCAQNPQTTEDELKACVKACSQENKLDCDGNKEVCDEVCKEATEKQEECYSACSAGHDACTANMAA